MQTYAATSKDFPFKMSKTVLVTGANGFTGSYLLDVLQQSNYQVLALGHSNEANIDLLSCNLLNRNKLINVVQETQPDYVIHLAAIAFVAHGDIDDIYQTNIVGTRNLLEALSLCSKKPEAILLASSANIYGNTTVDPIRENIQANPANDYAVSKYAMEMMAKLWFDQLPITIVRPFNYTGLGQSEQFLIPKIVSHFRKKPDQIELGNLDVARDFSDVRTVADAYSRLLTAKAEGKVLNICSGTAYTLQEIISIMEEIAGFKIKVRVNPLFVRANEIKFLRGCNEQLVSTIGDLLKYPIRSTLEWMYNGTSLKI